MLYERMLQARRALQSNIPQESNFKDTYYEDEEKVTGRKEEVLVGHNYIDDNSETDNTLGEGHPIADPESPNDLDCDKNICENDNTNEIIESEFKNNNEEDITSYIINFYKEHPEFVERLFENGGLNPILTKLDFAKDQILAALQQIGIDPGDALKAHDRHFQELAKVKKDEWDKEDVEHMKKIASQIIAEKDLFGGAPFSDTEMKESFKRFETPTIEKKEESMDKLQEMENPKEDTSGKTDSHVAKFLENYAEGNDIIQVLRKDLMSVLSDMQWIVESNNSNEQWALDFADALNEISITI